jgi:hypothetical protein
MKSFFKNHIPEPTKDNVLTPEIFVSLTVFINYIILKIDLLKRKQCAKRKKD